MKKFDGRMKLENDKKRLRLPPWLKKDIIPLENANYVTIKKQMKSHRLATVCLLFMENICFAISLEISKQREVYMFYVILYNFLKVIRLRAFQV